LPQFLAAKVDFATAANPISVAIGDFWMDWQAAIGGWFNPKALPNTVSVLRNKQ